MTYINEIPVNYDSTSLRIDPERVNDAAIVIEASVERISDFIEDINEALSDLTLSWAGASASKAQAYNDEWTRAIQKLFGTKSDPNSGALSVLVNGVSNAAQNYSQTEQNIASTFTAFGGAFSGTSTNKSSPSTKSVTDEPKDRTEFGTGGPTGSTFLFHTTSVDETF